MTWWDLTGIFSCVARKTVQEGTGLKVMFRERSMSTDLRVDELKTSLHNILSTTNLDTYEALGISINPFP